MLFVPMHSMAQETEMPSADCSEEVVHQDADIECDLDLGENVESLQFDTNFCVPDRTKDKTKYRC